MQQTQTVREEKKEAVSRLVEKLNSAHSVFLTDYSGLSVQAITNLRRNLRKSKVDYLVAKNTLTRLAAQQAGIAELVPHLEGPTAIAFGTEDPAAPAKVIADFLKTNSKPAIKAIVFEGKYFEASAAEDIAKLPGRQELLGRLAGTLAAPITGLASALQGILRKLAYAMNAVAEKRAESGGSPAPQNEPADLSVS